jgi:hypothetical protein
MQDDFGPPLVARVEMFVSIRRFIQCQFMGDNP